MPEVLRDVEQQLREHGCRVTGARRRIARQAFAQPGHFSAEGLRAAVEREGERVSRASVYRTLERLVGLGLLRRHALAGAAATYEAVLGRHDHEHLVCERCGTILEFVEHEIERLQDAICRAHRFAPRSRSLQIRGVCASCQAAPSDAAPARGGGAR